MSGKNTADIKLVIDAMDFLHLKRVEGIVILSSDRLVCFSEYIAVGLRFFFLLLQ